MKYNRYTYATLRYTYGRNVVVGTVDLCIWIDAGLLRAGYSDRLALSLTAGVLASTDNALFTLADFDCNKSDHHISATKFLSATCQSCSCRHAVAKLAYPKLPQAVLWRECARQKRINRESLNYCAILY